MMVLGLLLVALAAFAAVGAVFLLDGDASYFGIDLDAFSVFLLGAATAALIVVGVKLVRMGARRQLRARREHKRLSKLSDKLEASERRDGEDAES